MAAATLRRLRDDFHAGRIDGARVVETAAEYAGSPVRAVREATLDLLAEAADSDPDCGGAIADCVATRLEDGRPLSDDELRSLCDIAAAAPTGMGPVVSTLADRLATSGHPPGSGIQHVGELDADAFRSTDGRRLAAAVLGEVGAGAPGVVKPAVPALVATVDAEGAGAREAMWALVRTATAEPAVLRPYLAGRIWALEDRAPPGIAAALDDLGHVGSVLPERLVALDRVVALFDHASPTVRAAAVRALGRIVGRPQYDGDTVGRPRSDAGTFAGPIVRLLSDPDPDVRGEAVRATALLSRVDAAAVEHALDRLDPALNASDWRERMEATGIIGTVVEATGRAEPSVADRLARSIADDDADVRQEAGRGVIALLADGSCPDERSRRRLAELLLLDAFRTDGYHFMSEPEPSPDAIEQAIDTLGTAAVVRTARSFLRHERADLRRCSLDVLGTTVGIDQSVRRSVVAVASLYLSDRDAEVRKRAVSTLETAATVDHVTAVRVADVLGAHAAESPGTLERTLHGLATVSDRAPDAVGRVLDTLLERYPAGLEDDEIDEPADEDADPDGTDDSGGGMRDIVQDALDHANAGDASADFDAALAVVADEVAAELAPRVDTLADRAIELGSVEATRCLLAGLSAGGDLNPDTVAALVATLRNDDHPPDVQAGFAGAIRLANPNRTADQYAADRLHSLIERQGTNAAPDIVARLTAVDPELAAPFVPSLRWRALSGSPDLFDACVRIAAASPRFALPLREALVEAWRGRSDADPDDLEPLAGTDRWPLLAPTILDRAVFTAEPGLEPAVRAADTPSDAWSKHPVPALRAGAEASALDDSVDSGTGDDPAGPDLDTVADAGLAAALAQEGGRPEPVTGARTEPVHRGFDAEDPAVRATAVRAAGRLLPLAASDTRDRYLDRLLGSLADPDPSVRAAAARVAAERAHVGTIPPGRVAERVEPLFDGDRQDRLAAAEAAGSLVAAESGTDGAADAVSDPIVVPLRSALAAPERGVRRRAVVAIGRGAAAEAFTRIDTSELALYRLPDATVRTDLAPAIDAIDPASVPDPPTAARVLAAEIAGIDDPFTAHAVGSLLADVVARAPRSTGGPVVDAVREPEADTHGVESTVAFGRLTSHYWLCRAGAELSTVDPEAASRLDGLVAELLEWTDPENASASLGRAPGGVPAIDRVELRRAGLTAAGRCGVDRFPEALDSSLSAGETGLIDPTATAQFLLRADDEVREPVIERLTDPDAESHHGTVVAAIADAGSEAAGNDPRYDDRLTLLAALTLVPGDRGPVRQAVSFAVGALSEADPTVRISAAETLAELAGADDVPADEALAHLLPAGRDPDRRVREAAGEAVAAVADDGSFGVRNVARIASRWVCDGDEGTRDGGVRILGAVAGRYPSVRGHAVETLEPVREDPDIGDATSDVLTVLRRLDRQR